MPGAFGLDATQRKAVSESLDDGCFSNAPAAGFYLLPNPPAASLYTSHIYDMRPCSETASQKYLNVIVGRGFSSTGGSHSLPAAQRLESCPVSELRHTV
jgi:hypothetical protein